MNQRKFEQSLIRHKKLITKYNTSNDASLIPIISELGEELTIAYAQAKCENPKCKKTENLQIHHVWQRKNKHYTNIHKFMAQRYYWADMLLLCNDCHAKIEDRENSKYLFPEEHKSISQQTIDRIKGKYGITDEKIDKKLEKGENTKVAIAETE